MKVDAPSATGMNHADACTPDLALDRVSAFLLQLAPGAKPQDVKFALAQLPDVKIVEGNSALTSSRQALSALLIGISVFTAFQLTALLILVSLLFSAIVHERHREIGLLRAMGARPNQVTAILLAEAAIITGLGGLAGLGFGAVVLLTFARSLGFYFELLGVPFAWPSSSDPAGRRAHRAGVFRDPRSPRCASAGVAGAPNATLCAHPDGRPVT